MSTATITPRRRPLTLAEYNALSPDQLAQLGLADQTEGAPMDFGGPVFANPSHVRPADDTDSGIPVTRLPDGVSFNRQNFEGAPQMDTSTPLPAQSLAPLARTVGTESSGKPVTLDMSTAQPIEGVKLDMSTAQPIDEKADEHKDDKPHSTWQQVKDAIHEVIDSPFYQDIGKGMSQLGKNPIDPLYEAINSAIEGKGSKRTLPENVGKGTWDALVGKTPGETVGKVLSLGVGAVAASGEGEAPEPTTKGAINKSAVAADLTRVLSPKAADIIEAIKSGKYADLIPERAQAAGRLYKHLTEGVTPPTPDTPPVPEHFGKGQYGTPLDQWGQRIQPEAAPAPAAAAPPAAAPKPTITPKAVEQQLNDALGGKPLEKNVPIGKQTAVTPTKAAAAEVPEGFKPVQSSVLKGYKYDPATKEFEAITNTGQRYRAGEVTQDQVDKFEATDSKGKAWNELRSNSTPLGKYVGDNFQPYKRAGLRSSDPLEAKRQNLEDFIDQKPDQKPAAKPKTLKDLAAPKADEGDLTDLLAKSLQQTKGGKAGGVQTMADPAKLTKRWGVDSESLASGREQTRGMTAEQTEDYIEKLAERYRQGKEVEPVLETRDAQNNIISVDGRARAIAAERAGVKRIPIIVKRTTQGAR